MYMCRFKQVIYTLNFRMDKVSTFIKAKLYVLASAMYPSKRYRPYF